MSTHGYLPASLLQSAIVPILKNRQGDTSDKNNSRLIAMNVIELHLVSQDNQFNFRKKHSTDLCIFTVNSTIKYYNHAVQQSGLYMFA